LLNWLEDPTVGGAELNGFSRLARVAGGAAAVPAVMSDIHDGNSVAEAVTREGVGLAAGLGSGAAAGALIGSVVPGAGTAVGVVVGAVVGGGASLLASKVVEQVWHPMADAVGDAVHSVESVFGFG
jgi:carbon monoxide dehydrogenase subunit G